MCDRVQSGYPKPGSVTCEAQGTLGPLNLLFTGSMFKGNQDLEMSLYVLI